MRLHLFLLAALPTALPACGAKPALEIGDPCRPDPEVCDGVDNDCDGQIDEDIAPITCGQSGCETTVRCEDGVLPACVPRDPEPEACNLKDDDCDGEVDEGFGFGPLGDVTILRSTEGSTGSCTSCKWAWGTTLAPTDDGMLALWNLGLSGGNEQPTLFGRGVDLLGQPTEPVDLLRQDFILELYETPALEPLPPKGFPIAADYRVGSDNVPGLLFVKSNGDTEAVLDIPGFGPFNVSRTVWSGERFVTAWEEDDELRVAVLEPDGSLDHLVDVDPLERPAHVTLGVYPGRVGILVSRFRDDPERRDSWFILLDARGNVVTPAHEIDLAYTTWQRLVGTKDGWLSIRPNGYQEPSLRQRLEPGGDPIEEPSVFDDLRSIGDSGLQDVFMPRPGLGEMVAAWQSDEGGGMNVELLDDAGDVLRGWSGPLPPTPGFDEGAFGSPHVTLVDAPGQTRLLVIWHGIADDAQPNLVALRSFGCVP